MRGLLEEPSDGIALHLTTTGTSGASTYNSITGILNIPIYSGGSSISFGTTTQIPYMNSGGTDFLYSSNFRYTGSQFITPTVKTDSILPLNNNSVVIGSVGDGSYILSDVGNTLFQVVENFNSISYDGLTLDITGKLKASNLTASRVLVSDASYSTTKQVMVSMKATATSDHDPEDYALESLIPYATNFQNGVGFDIMVRAPNLTWGQYIISYCY